MMILPNKKDAVHKAWLYRTLEAIADNPYLASVLYFKGGTCASMLDWLDRFSVDLDFDYAGSLADIPHIRTALEKVFADLGLSIHDSSQKGLQYFLKYENKQTSVSGMTSSRNTLKVDASFPLFASSKYEPQRFREIDRVIICQTKETMFAHKLVAIIDRFEKTSHIAGRDIYDIHHFFMNGFEFDEDVVRERRGVEPRIFLAQLADFIDKKVTDKIITEDLSHLLTLEKSTLMRKVLKKEVLVFIRESERKYSSGDLRG